MKLPFWGRASIIFGPLLLIGLVMLTVAYGWLGPVIFVAIWAFAIGFTFILWHVIGWLIDAD